MSSRYIGKMKIKGRKKLDKIKLPGFSFGMDTWIQYEGMESVVVEWLERTSSQRANALSILATMSIILGLPLPLNLQDALQ